MVKLNIKKQFAALEMNLYLYYIIGVINTTKYMMNERSECKLRDNS